MSSVMQSAILTRIAEAAERQADVCADALKLWKRIDERNSEVVAKLQGQSQTLAEELLREDAESEAVKLLERWNEWSGDTKRSEWLTLIDDTTALLSKLKGAAL